MKRRTFLLAAPLMISWTRSDAGFIDWYNGAKLGARLPEFDVEYLRAPPENPGKLTLIDFWATWCEPCRKDFAFLNQLHRELAHSGLTVIGLSSESREEVVPFLEKFELSYYVGCGGNKPLQDKLNIKALPYSILVDARDTIVWRGQVRELAKEDIYARLGKSG